MNPLNNAGFTGDVAASEKQGKPMHFRPVLRFKTTIATLVFLLSLMTCCPTKVIAQKEETSADKSEPGRLTLVRAVMCEKVEDYTPVNQGIIFSVGIGKVSCFNYFDPVPEDSFIYHKWFYRNKLSTRIKLSLKTPSWLTFSSIQLREADKGPWRVEVTESDGNILQTLRFSITD